MSEFDHDFLDDGDYVTNDEFESDQQFQSNREPYTNNFVPWEEITQPDLYDVYRDEQPTNWERKYPASERQSESFEPFKQFVDKLPMYWMPRKEEIGRLLSVAFQAHQERITKGEILSDTPIEIIDVGGGNGALAALLIDLAQENSLAIHITVVDPNKQTVENAKRYYSYDPRYYNKIDFFEGTASDFVKQMQQPTEEGQRLSAKRDEELTVAQTKLQRFKELEESLVDSASIDKIQRALQEEFHLPPMPDDFMADKPWMDPVVKLRHYAFWDPRDSLLPYIPSSITQHLTRTQSELEEYLAKQPATVDLVINSWMPSQQDFTRDIREINGATIAYALETWGATGIQEHARFPEHVDTIGQENSYQPGEGYTNLACWTGDSVSGLVEHNYTSRPRNNEEQQQWLQELQELPISSYYNYYSRRPENPDDEWDEEDTPELPFGNTIMIQLRKGYTLADVDPQKYGLSLGQQYSWEQTLTRTTGELGPVTYFSDYPNLTEYHQVIGAAIQNAQRQRWQTIDTSNQQSWSGFFDE